MQQSPQSEKILDAWDTRNVNNFRVENNSGNVSSPSDSTKSSIIFKSPPKTKFSSNDDSKNRVYWNSLVEMLRKQLDNIYNLCENDNNKAHVREVLNLLKNSVSNLEDLKNRLTEKDSQQNSRKQSQTPKKKDADLTKSTKLSEPVIVTATPRSHLSTTIQTITSPVEKQAEVTNQDLPILLSSSSPPIPAQMENTTEAVGMEDDSSILYDSAITPLKPSTPTEQIDSGISEFLIERSPGKTWAQITEESLLASPKKASIYERLSSPDRVKKLDPEELRIKQETKLAQAEQNRKIFESKKLQKAKDYQEKIQTISEKQNERITQLQTSVEKKLQRAEETKKKFVEKKTEEARNDLQRVKENVFIQKNSQENEKWLLSLETEKKMEESEQRRYEKIDGIKKKLSEDAQKELKAKKKRDELEEQKKAVLIEKEEEYKEKQERIKEEQKKSSEMRLQKAAARAEKFKKVSEKKKEEQEQIGKSLSKRLSETTSRKIENLEKIREKAQQELLKVKEVNLRKSDQQIELTEPASPEEGNAKLYAKRAKKIQYQLNLLKKQFDDSQPHEETEEPNDANNEASIQKSSSARLKRVALELHDHIQNKRFDQTKSYLQELIKILDSKKIQDIECLQQEGVVDMLVQMLLAKFISPNIYKLSLQVLIGLFSAASISSYATVSLQLLSIIDFTVEQLKMENDAALLGLQLVIQCLQTFSITNRQELEDQMKFQFCLYITTGTCMLDEIRRKFLNIKSLQDFSSSTPQLLSKLLSLMDALISMEHKNSNLDNRKKQIMENTLKEISYDCTVHLLSILVLQCCPTRKGKAPTQILPLATINVVVLSLKVMNRLAARNTKDFQKVIDERFQLEIQHIMSGFLNYCYRPDEALDICNVESPLKALVCELVLLAGYFCSQNFKLQEVLNYNSPSILQMLCQLPIVFFTDAKLRLVLLPTLICACFKQDENRAVLENEMSLGILSNFILDQTNNNSNLELVSRADFLFEKRFPRELFEEAKNYFTPQE